MAKVQEVKGDNFPELAGDTDITLTHVDTGCLLYDISGTVHCIIKERYNMIYSLIDYQKIRLSFSSIMKSEFPSAHMDIRFRTNRGLSGRYEYFFMLESQEDSTIFSELKDHKEFYLHLYNIDISRSYKLELEDDESVLIDNVFGEVRHLLTKEAR